MKGQNQKQRLLHAIFMEIRSILRFFFSNPIKVCLRGGEKNQTVITQLNTKYRLYMKALNINGRRKNPRLHGTV